MLILFLIQKKGLQKLQEILLITFVILSLRDGSPLRLFKSFMQKQDLINNHSSGNCDIECRLYSKSITSIYFNDITLNCACLNDGDNLSNQMPLM